jgi:hypothetical protein
VDAPFVLNRGIGAPLASGSTIAPPYQMHHVTGISGISTITTPTGIQPGEYLVLIFDALATLITGGNIGAGLSVGIVGQKVVLIWDGSKWY